MKYRANELRAMAAAALKARDAFDARWIFLCITLAMRFNCRFDEVEQRIEALAATA